MNIDGNHTMYIIRIFYKIMIIKLKAGPVQVLPIDADSALLF